MVQRLAFDPSKVKARVRFPVVTKSYIFLPLPLNDGVSLSTPRRCLDIILTAFEAEGQQFCNYMLRLLAPHGVGYHWSPPMTSICEFWKLGMCLHIVFVCAICGFPSVKEGTHPETGQSAHLETDQSDFHHLSPPICSPNRPAPATLNNIMRCYVCIIC